MLYGPSLEVSLAALAAACCVCPSSVYCRKARESVSLVSRPYTFAFGIQAAYPVPVNVHVVVFRCERQLPVRRHSVIDFFPHRHCHAAELLRKAERSQRGFRRSIEPKALQLTRISELSTRAGTDKELLEGFAVRKRPHCARSTDRHSLFEDLNFQAGFDECVSC